MKKHKHVVELSDEEGSAYLITITEAERGEIHIDSQPALGVDPLAALGDLLLASWHVAGSRGDHLLAECISQLVQVVADELEGKAAPAKKKRPSPRKGKGASSDSSVAPDDNDIPF